MSPSNWIRITPVENIPLREGREVELGKERWTVFNLGDRVVALENRCPHQNGPIADGIVSTYAGRLTVTCPLHARRICVDSGQVIKPAGGECLRTLPAKVESGIVMIDVAPLLRQRAVSVA